MYIYKTNFTTEAEGKQVLIDKGVWEEVTEEGVTQMPRHNSPAASAALVRNFWDFWCWPVKFAIQIFADPHQEKPNPVLRNAIKLRVKVLCVNVIGATRLLLDL